MPENYCKNVICTIKCMYAWIYFYFVLFVILLNLLHNHIVYSIYIVYFWILLKIMLYYLLCVRLNYFCWCLFYFIFFRRKILCLPTWVYGWERFNRWVSHCSTLRLNKIDWESLSTWTSNLWWWFTFCVCVYSNMCMFLWNNVDCGWRWMKFNVLIKLFLLKELTNKIILRIGEWDRRKTTGLFSPSIDI